MGDTVAALFLSPILASSRIARPSISRYGSRYGFQGKVDAPLRRLLHDTNAMLSYAFERFWGRFRADGQELLAWRHDPRAVKMPPSQ